MFTATFLTSLLCVFNKKSYLCIAFRKTLGLKHRLSCSVHRQQTTVLRAIKRDLVLKHPRMVNGQWSTVNGQRSMVNGQWSMVNVQ